MEEEKNQPIERISIGRIEAAIWENRNDTNVWHAVTFSRWYRDEEQSKTTSSFHVEDLPLLERLSQMAFRVISKASGVVAGGK